MPRSPRTFGASGKQLSDTLIFVDVDGVLNIGIFDPTGRPLELSTHNVETALKHWGVREGHSQRDCIERIVEVYSHEVGHGEASTYEEFLADPRSGVSAVLVERLARIITAAKEGSNNVEVVLSSSWRKPQHAVRVGALEGVLSKCLGYTFHFHSRTELCDDRLPGMRVSVIGNFIEQYCQGKGAGLSDIDVVVLDDFFITPLDGWSCGDVNVHQPGDIERYLKGRSPLPASVKLLHTYDQWKLGDGSTMQVGSGLTKDHLGNAIDFLVQRRNSQQVPEPSSEPEPIEPPMTYAMDPIAIKAIRNISRFLHLPGGSLMSPAIPADYSLVT